MATLSVSVQAGATNGPVDMSINLTLLLVEAGIFIARLPPVDLAQNLRTRLSATEAQAEQQGSSTMQLSLSPLEQGLMLGCLSDVSGQFAVSLLVRIQQAINQKLAALGAPTDFS